MLSLLLLLATVETVTEPFAGGTLKHRVEGGQDLWVLRLDLCAPGVSVRATADGERGRTVGSFASLTGAQAAINGDFFGSGFNTDGLAAHNGEFWGAGVDHTYVAPVAFGPAHVDISHHNNQLGAPFWAKEVVSGHPTLLDDGVVVGNPGDPLCTNRHPRTALGISADHRTLVVLVVDGRRPGAAGMTCDEMAFVLAAEGAFDAVNLDGGGSSTLVVNGAVKNVPSDGNQRTVGNHLGFFAVGSGPSPQCPDFVDPICGGDADLQQCNGTVITTCQEGAPSANGDCGFFGAGCSTEGGLAHCVHPYCAINLAGGETGTFCVDDSKLATCDLGVYTEGDCGAFGATCSDAGGTGDVPNGHCVHFMCHSTLNGGEDGVFCKDAETLSSCALGVYVERACVEGCVDEDATAANGVGARCAEDPLPEPGEGEGEGEPGEGEGEPGGDDDDDDEEDDEDDDNAPGARPRAPVSSIAASCAATTSSSASLAGLALFAVLLASRTVRSPRAAARSRSESERARPR